MKKIYLIPIILLSFFVFSGNVFAREKMTLPLPLSYKTTGTQYVSGGSTTTQTLTDIYTINQNNRYQTPAMRLGSYNGRQYTFTAEFYFPAMGYQSADMTLKFYYNYNVELLVSVGNRICDFDITTYTAHCENVNLYNQFTIEVYQNDSLITQNYYDNVQIMYEGSYIEVDYSYTNLVDYEDITLPGNVNNENAYIDIFKSMSDDKYYLKFIGKGIENLVARINGVPMQSFNSAHTYYCTNAPSIGCQNYLFYYVNNQLYNNNLDIFVSNTLDFSNATIISDSNTNPVVRADRLIYSNHDIYISSNFYSNMSQYYQNNFKWFDLDNYLYTLPIIENYLWVDGEKIKLHYKITQWTDTNITSLRTNQALTKEYTREDYLQNNEFDVIVRFPTTGNTHMPVVFYDNDTEVARITLNLVDILDSMPQDQANEVIAQEQWQSQIYTWGEDSDYSNTIKGAINNSSQIIQWARELVQYIFDNFPSELKIALVTCFIIFIIVCIIRMIWR